MVFQPLKAALLDMKGFPFPQSNLTIQASSSLLPLIKKSFYSTTSIFIHFFVHHENHILDHYVLMMLSNDQILYHLSKLKWWNSITRTLFWSRGRRWPTYCRSYLMITWFFITIIAQLICKHLDYEFDVLMSVVPGVLNGSRGYFTLFSSKHKYFIKQTAICFYSIEAINRHFSTSNSFYDNETFETKKWPPTTLNSNTAHPKGIDPTNTDF